MLEYARIESDCFSGRHVTNRISLGKMNIPGRMQLSEALYNVPALVLVCCCGLLCTHLRDPVPHFRRHPFSDYGLESMCVCVCESVGVIIFPACGVGYWVPSSPEPEGLCW